MLMHHFGFSERYVVSSAIEITFPSVCLSVCLSLCLSVCDERELCENRLHFAESMYTIW